MFGERWENILLNLFNIAQGMGANSGALFVAMESAAGGIFDIKTNDTYGGQGRLLGDYYVSSRSAGNLLAGMNARGLGMEFSDFQKIAGGLHQGNGFGAVRAALGLPYGEAPYYGETSHQFKWSLRGYRGQLR